MFLKHKSVSVVSSLMSAFLIFVPFYAHAGSFSDFIAGLFSQRTDAAEVARLGDALSRTVTSQNVALLKAVETIDPKTNLAADVVIVGDVAIMPESGPIGTIADVTSQSYTVDSITIYTVRQGDTVDKIARMFGVSVNTIVWGNDLKNAKDIRIGEDLVILPVSGVVHVVKKGDTIQNIAKKYGGDVEEILRFNDLEGGAKLSIGDEIIVPDGEVSTPIVPKGPGPTKLIATYINKSIDSLAYYIRPVVNGRKTQGLHGKNGIDIAPTCRCGGEEPILAAAAGQVLVAKTGGWNGGFGNYVVISHPNGTQTVYSHMYNVKVSRGQNVEQGQLLGYVGSTGNSTGNHVHFEIRGAVNPF
ncbi:MAG: peptidoglycan DD-metalloendopeptidase family protein [Candidatus Vogelbacteria bacterium]|nr:peptidoglycan DD-metalloendopeptidase family protein [Candidatus Vogelbacteria bacterium]